MEVFRRKGKMDSEKQGYSPQDGQHKPQPQPQPQPQPNPLQQGYSPQQGYPPQQSYPPQQGYPSQQPPTSHPQSNAGFQSNPTDCGVPPPYSTAGQQYQLYPPTSNGQSVLSTVVVSQPGGDIAPVAMPVPPNHMALAWITCLCCFWPLGIAAIIQANKVDSAVSRGDLAAAESASRSSRNMSLCSIGIGIILIIALVILKVSNPTFNT